MSARKKRKGVEARDKLYKLLECPICLDTMGPPIFQCREGHLICSPCREKIDKCPTCRIPLDNIRNRALENMVAKMVMPCPNRIFGCTMTPRFEDMVRHQEVCQYRMYHCPRSRLVYVQGPLSQVADHLKEKHNRLSHTTIMDSLMRPIESGGVKTAVWEGPMMTCSSEVFLMHFEQLPSRVRCVRSIFRERGGASRFRYRMTIEHGGRSLTWKVCRARFVTL